MIRFCIRQIINHRNRQGETNRCWRKFAFHHFQHFGINCHEDLCLDLASNCAESFEFLIFGFFFFIQLECNGNKNTSHELHKSLLVHVLTIFFNFFIRKHVINRLVGLLFWKHIWKNDIIQGILFSPNLKLRDFFAQNYRKKTQITFAFSRTRSDAQNTRSLCIYVVCKLHHYALNGLSLVNLF